uniref:UDP-glycosyltransferases domain-containing protein n=1 Tax=Apteryx owenii TaxID=8824 RepID=A0A8B9PNY5_APTOW
MSAPGWKRKLPGLLGCGSGGKVLVWPADNSHWLNMNYILQQLVARGHEVTVLLPSCFLILDPSQPSPFQFEVVEVPITKKEMATLLEEAFYFWIYEQNELPIWEAFYKMGQLMIKMRSTNKIICNEVLTNKALLERLRASAFDVFLSDPLMPGGELFAEKLGIPFVYTFRFSIGNTVERLCGGLPAPPSYVPAILSRQTDSLSFMERLQNIIFYDFLNTWVNEFTNLSSWEVLWKMKKDLEVFTNMSKMTCDTLVLNPQLMAKLQQAKFDILIADPLYIGGELVAEILAIPFIYSFRFSIGNTAERLCGRLPSPPSYVPASMGRLMDRMHFMERLRNFLFYLYTDYFYLEFWRDKWDEYYSDVLGKIAVAWFLLLHRLSEMWLIRTYWDFEFPRPFLPNFEFVGGLHCQPAKPLPKEMEEFVQSSGEHGIVVFSLGSMVYNLTDEKSNIIAGALSQLPQKVLWRYKGRKPETLGSNTRIYDWIPQNDLLGHPLTKAFITHGGTNGIYEAIYHGVPLVGIPMFADQHDNIAHMRAKGAAVELDFGTLKTQDLVDAVNTVINNSTYKENALRLSRIHHDQPMKPLDRAVFWIEFVMRHKGAKHLRPASHHLTWYQYHCLDVLAFLFTCAAIAVFILVKCCLFCCNKCGRITKKKKE